MANFPLPKGYQRLGAFPLDETALFSSLALLESYALNNGSAYAGQICSVSTGAVVECYQINTDKTVSLIGTGGAGGTLPGVEIDCGTFANSLADIDCGSFV